MSTTVEPRRAAPASWRRDVRDAGWDVGVPVVLAIVVLTTITAVAGLLIAHEPRGGIGALDLRASQELVTHRTPGIDALTGVGVGLANTVPVAVLWVGAMVIGAVVTRRWTIPMFLLAAVGGEKLTYLLAGAIVRRARPPVESIGEVFATSSFPSGHAGAAVTLYGGMAIAAIWYLEQRRGRRVAPSVRLACGVVVAAIAAFVAFSRVWRGQHYPSDVVWGAALGVAWLAVAWWSTLRRATLAADRDLGPAGPRS